MGARIRRMLPVRYLHGALVAPQQGKSDTPRACAVAYHAAVRQGLLFVLPKPLPPALLPSGTANDSLVEALTEAVAAEARIPLVPELEETDGNWISQVWQVADD